MEKNTPPPPPKKKEKKNVELFQSRNFIRKEILFGYQFYDRMIMFPRCENHDLINPLTPDNPHIWRAIRRKLILSPKLLDVHYTVHKYLRASQENIMRRMVYGSGPSVTLIRPCILMLYIVRRCI